MEYIIIPHGRNITSRVKYCLKREIFPLGRNIIGEKYYLKGEILPSLGRNTTLREKYYLL